MATNSYDVLIVGAGIAGCAMAHALATRKNSTKKLRIGLLERSLAEPDRIVGELLQPGGVQALKTLGMDWCLEGIDAVPIGGYCVVNAAADEQVHIPYPNSHEGRGFHHGKFIMRLREAAMRAPGVETIEATVSELITKADAVVGVAARRTTPSGEPGPIESFHAALTIVADGCFSNFRNFVLGSQSCKPEVKSHFMGFVLKDAKLPIPNHGTVVLVKDSGPVLLYQIGDDSKETRVLVDLKIPVPADPKDFIISHIIPQLPKSLHSAFHAALDGNRLRRMPNSFLPSVQQGRPAVDSKKGVFLLGDSWNMRHPLTGGGMTVAFTDVVILQSLLASTDFTNWDEISAVLRRWHWERKGLSSTINILSVALYNLFGAEDENLAVLRRGCFEYFNRGGDCVTGPVTLLSGLSDSPLLLARHFFSVALYAIYIMFADSSILLYPYLVLKSFFVFYTAIIVFMPLVWSEVRWWSPDDSVSVRKYTLRSLSAILMASGILFYCGMFPTIPLLL